MAGNDPSLAYHHGHGPPASSGSSTSGYAHQHPTAPQSNRHATGIGGAPIRDGSGFFGTSTAGIGPGIGSAAATLGYESAPAGAAGGSAGGGGGGTAAPHPPPAAFHHPQQQQQQEAVEAGPANAAKPIRRRMRMITSCMECRRRKLRCDKAQTCSNCVRNHRECIYMGPKLDEAGQLKLTELKEKAGQIERQLERDVAKVSRAAQQQRFVADDVDDEYDEERDLEITPMVALDATYEDDVDGSDDVIDLGIQIGRMRITERIGGLNRPRISEEIKAGLGGGATPGTAAYQHGSPFNGQPSASVPSQGTVPDASGSQRSIPEFLRPGPSYIPPSSSLCLGQAGTLELINFLPAKATGDRLLQRYLDAVHPVARCLHWPSFEVQYENFWRDVAANYEPRPSVQAVVFAAWFSAAVSLDEPTIIHEFGSTKGTLLELLKLGTETALSKANFLRTTKVETLQALVMYMIPLCRDEVSRAHSILVGAAVRIAECMGLHRDGETYGLTPLEAHVRRLIWHQLCFLDVRTCEAQGPKPAIRREDYDTKLPVNCEEGELTNAINPPPSAEHWTSTLLPLIRFEVNEMMRIIWVDRRKLEKQKTPLSNVLTKIENFRTGMLEKYSHYLDDAVPIQRYTRLVMLLLLERLRVMVLHPYHSNATNPMPARLNNVLISSGAAIIEIAIELETHPLFRDWAWYIGAFQQFQIALLLVTELYYRPGSKYEKRILRCINYVFTVNRNLTAREQTKAVLEEIAYKTSVYMSLRKMRGPTTLTNAVPDQAAVKNEQAAHPMLPPSGQQQQQPMQAQQQHMGMKSEPGMRPVVPSIPNSMMQSGLPTTSQMPTTAVTAMPPVPPMQPPMQPPAPPPNFVWAGVSNGEALWSLPQNSDSPENSSDGGSIMNGARQGGPTMPAAGGGFMAENIDWDAINALFPQDPQSQPGNYTGFLDPTSGMKWQ
ncbi:Fungal specific transcription factor domain-containing protein [Pleurostoma richardsiae]|uniref:Fungal specific transcription factor domain-containing protein n=1 Tax=Pleurostoma richardsiae TaxID=41990 RepID=A0AA38VMN4_9PEZI|nr:Fungal specific transcription factor domain-containing protein [Pleurostoma richardsiae]